MFNARDFLILQSFAIKNNYFEKGSRSSGRSKIAKYNRKYIGKNGKWVYVYDNPDYKKQEEKVFELSAQVRTIKKELVELKQDRERIDWDMNLHAGEYQEKHGDNWNEKWEADDMHNEYGEQLNKIDKEISEKQQEIEKLYDEIGKNDIGPVIHHQSDDDVPASLLQAESRINKAVFDELEKAGVSKKKVIRDEDVKPGSPDDYGKMSNGEKLAHHYYAAQHEDNKRKQAATKIAEHATSLGKGTLAKEDYDKLVKEHNTNINNSHKKYQQHIDIAKKLGSAETLDEVEKVKAGNWINTHYSDQDKEGYKVNPDKVSQYYEKYGDLHNQKYSKSAEQLYNDILSNCKGEHEIADIDAVYTQLDEKDLKLGKSKNPMDNEGQIIDKIETLKSNIKLKNKKLDDEAVEDILRAILKTVNKKEEKK